MMPFLSLAFQNTPKFPCKNVSHLFFGSGGWLDDVLLKFIVCQKNIIYMQQINMHYEVTPVFNKYIYD